MHTFPKSISAIWNAKSHPGFELRSPCPFPLIIIITPQVPAIYIIVKKKRVNNVKVWVKPKWLSAAMFPKCQKDPMAWKLIILSLNFCFLIQFGYFVLSYWIWWHCFYHYDFDPFHIHSLDNMILILFMSTHLIIVVIKIVHCPVGWGCRIHWLLLCRGVRPPQRVSWIWH